MDTIASMSNAGRSTENRKIQPRLASETHAYLDDLRMTGLYGNTNTQVAQKLIELGIMDAIAKRHIDVRKTDPSGRRK